jgi:hypothetical protein
MSPESCASFGLVSTSIIIAFTNKYGVGFYRVTCLSAVTREERID